ncbi:uncharacterized protein LOC122028858 [Zingiber officinale]|uniref:Bromo domain-containing protein n=1 Tax=Zingiber officinale TaxID=94328 RepID=A0A8J5BG42_ZINOF|nr:uncharacterized protein LOC122028858 [Zingiber officinale]XP_042443724.1 uncharacterized protein LOC122028858 [Zingiber officinale]KAG6471496.1 hypothetical protein ZIOFF_068938 [Zingiber officinale]
MERSGDPEEKEVWGTREELLLAFAVVRHGTRRWDFVATEIQSHASGSRSLTAQGCFQRFRDLQSRFGAGAVDGGVDDDGGDADVPWLEELRRLRVAELRREVDQYDFSIRSLQSKVKSLQEERERRLAESESGDGKPSYEGKEEAPPGSRPESLVGEPSSSAGASGPSFERSDSTDPKEKHSKAGRKPHTAIASDGEDVDATDPSSGGDEKAAEGSYNGSTGSPAEGRTFLPHATGEFTVESKSGEGEKESSDMQSSASLSRRRKAVSSSGVKEMEAEQASIMSKHVVAESQPLLSVLAMIRSDKYGSIFNRRFESQESAIYRDLVRQPMDLEMVRVKLDRAGSDSPYSTAEFFRDLFLLCTNAAVFFPRDSPESVAALHLRRVVAKEMAAVFPVQKELTPPPIPLPPKPPVPMPKAEPGFDGAFADKPISSAPLIMCRKPSSISNKLVSEEVRDEKEEKPGPSESEEKSLPKKITKDRSVLSGTIKGLRTSNPRVGKAQAAAAAKRLNLATVPNLKSKMVENEAAVDEPRKPDKKNGDGRTASTSSAAKRQSAAGFLNRMKRSPKGSLMDTSKNSPPPGPVSDGKATEQKKEAKGKQQSARVAAASGGSRSAKKAADTSGAGSGKRSVGRPPKRGSAIALPPAKRAREESEPPSIARSTASTSRKRGRR